MRNTETHPVKPKSQWLHHPVLSCSQQSHASTSMASECSAGSEGFLAAACSNIFTHPSPLTSRAYCPPPSMGPCSNWLYVTMKSLACPGWGQKRDLRLPMGATAQRHRSARSSVLEAAPFPPLPAAPDSNLINAAKLFNVYQLGKVHKQRRDRSVE